MGLILADFVRNQLLFGRNGLPLGFLASKQQFTDFKYLISPEFRFGLAGIPQRHRRLLFGLFILASSLISLFAGPAAALLLIPTQRSGWPAGGASFWLAGNDDILWPSKLTGQSVAGSICESPNLQKMSNEALNSSGCIWAGYSSLAETFKHRHLNNEIDIIVDDGVLKRDFEQRARGEVTETWVLASHLAVGVLAKDIARFWAQTLGEIRASDRHHKLRSRVLNETRGYVQAWVPAVRSRCAVYDPFFYNTSVRYLEV